MGVPLRQGVVSSRRFPFSAAFPPGAGPARQGPFSAQEGSERSPAIVSMGSCGASGRRRPGVGVGGRCSPSYPLIGRCLERRQHRAGFVQPQGHPGKDRPQHWLPSVAPRAETRGPRLSNRRSDTCHGSSGGSNHCPSVRHKFIEISLWAGAPPAEGWNLLFSGWFRWEGVKVRTPHAHLQQTKLTVNFGSAQKLENSKFIL